MAIRKEILEALGVLGPMPMIQAVLLLALYHMSKVTLGGSVEWVPQNDLQQKALDGLTTRGLVTLVDDKVCLTRAGVSLAQSMEK